VEEHKACFPGNGVLSQQLDSWMEEFEAEEARRKADAAAALAAARQIDALFEQSER